MNSILNQNIYFVKEQVGYFKFSSNYDIYHPETRAIQMTCREPEIGIFTKIFRFLGYKVMTPFNIVISTPDGTLVARVKRGVSFLRSVVEVFDENENAVGKFRQRLLTIGGKFDVLDTNDQPLCTLQGKWTSWEFSFKKDNLEFAKVTKQWSGIGKELFTTADNYVLQINDAVPQNNNLRVLILSAVLCIDLVLKENKN